ncbi:MAG: hypothetical protein E7434_01540 [Ruminococcaceae bacterium]|nr:hypothetical protein [Oscillospiraceae bacterium]
MQIPIYLAVKNEEIVKHRTAQLGFGFYPNGSVRLPAKILPNSIAVIDDLYLPNFTQSAVEMLKSKLIRGCILDFERKITPQHQRLVKILPKIIALPEAYHELAPKALPIVTCSEPCNSWLQFLSQTQKKFPNGWMLEIVPWKRKVSGSAPKNEGFLKNAICRYKQQDGELMYFDTKQTIEQKLTLVQSYSCRAALGLLEELRKLQ